MGQSHFDYFFILIGGEVVIIIIIIIIIIKGVEKSGGVNKVRRNLPIASLINIISMTGRWGSKAPA